MIYKVWNNLPKPEECNVEATENDLLYVSGGYMFLVMTAGDINNVVCFRYLPKGKTTFKEAVRQFLYWCKNNDIQFLRVEGNSKRYNFFLNPHFFPHLKRNGLSVLKDPERTDRNIFYIKVF